jgi:transposase
MDPRQTPDTTRWPYPFSQHDWDQTPPAVQAYLRILQDELTQSKNHVETLEARLMQTSKTSHRPPSSDSPYKRSARRSASAARCCCLRRLYAN